MRYWVLAALCATAVLAYLTRNCLAVPREGVQEDLDLSDPQMEQVLGAFYLGYALFQIPGGWLADRWGTRLTLTVFLAGWSVATGFNALAGGFISLMILQVTVGMAQACAFPCCVKTFSRWFPPTQRAFPSGLLASFMSAGGAMEKLLTGFLIGYLTWQGIVALYAVPGLLFAVWFFLWFRDRPDQHPAVNAEELRLIGGADGKTPDRPAPVPWGALLRSPRLGLICLQQFFRAGAYVFYPTLFPTFLRRARGLSESESGYLTSLPLFGVVLGSIAGGLMIDQIFRRTGSIALSRKGVALAGTASAAVFLLLAYGAQDVFLTIALAVASAFAAALAGPAGYTITIDQGGRHVATVFSFMNMGGNIAAFLLPGVLGSFVRQTGWDDALLFVAAMYAAAALCWTILPMHGRVVAEDT